MTNIISIIRYIFNNKSYVNNRFNSRFNVINRLYINDRFNINNRFNENNISDANDKSIVF